jgi:phosphoserine phosphatase
MDRATALAALKAVYRRSAGGCSGAGADTRRKKILIADMDSTMIGQECIDELAAEVGLKDKVSAITARAMNGEIAFEPALRERVALLKGLPVDVIGQVIDSRITLTPGRTRAGGHHAGQWRPYGAGLGRVYRLHIRGGGMIGFDENHANVLESQRQASGTVREPILGKQAKVDALEDSARLGLDPSDAIAVGDGANDLGMLELAGSGVALHAKPSVAAQADIRIDHGDLTALLYLQGYRKTDFVTP